MCCLCRTDNINVRVEGEVTDLCTVRVKTNKDISGIYRSEYDLGNLDEPNDLFIIDGPPAKKSKNARFPALPLMFDNMKSGTIIILDDVEYP